MKIDMSALRGTGPERYRGYWICSSPFRPEIWIEKDKAYICAAKSNEHARQQIDELLD